MEFSSPSYPYLLLLALTAVVLAGPRRVLQNALLMVASCAFLGLARPAALPWLLGSLLLNHLLGGRLAAARPGPARVWLLRLGIGANLLPLCTFKYTGFVLDNAELVAGSFGAHLPVPELGLTTPLGMSFYTFQAIAYLVDVARGRAEPARSVLDFALFTALFPKLAAGPICRASELLTQVERARVLLGDVPRAMTLIAAGAFKKLVLGTYLATHMVEDAFQRPELSTRAELWVAMFAYTAQIYLDFSGYTDIARGSALLLGFELPENFRYPYAASDLSEYWRRWHLSLSRFLRDYVYLELGGSRGGTARTARNLLLTFALCGLWHGARWGFVIWGLLHGLGLVAHKLVRDARRAQGRPPTPAPRRGYTALCWAGTLLYCALARVFFKAETLTSAGHFLRGLIVGGGTGLGFEWGVVAITAVTIALNFLGPPLFAAAVRLHARVPRPYWPVSWLALAVLILTLEPYDVALTIYFGF